MADATAATPLAAAAPAAAPTPGPVLTSDDFHPDNPGPMGWLINSLNTRLMAIEAKLGLPALLSKAETAAQNASGFVATAKADVTATVSTVETELTNALHKIEDALHIPHG